MAELPERPPRVRGTTRLVGLLGWPVDRSLSPPIHNAAFGALGMDWAYVPLPVEPAQLAEAIAGLRALGFAGANVTMPHKTGCADLIEDLSADARTLRAVNTIVVGPNGLSGHNTDATGFERFLVEDVGFEPAGRTALLFGAGGAARACALALARGGLGSLSVAVREPERARDLLAAVEGFATSVGVVGFEEAGGVVSDLVVNATPLGGKGEALPAPPLGPGVVVVDLLYRPQDTALQRAARGAGGVAFGGLGLLLHQAALAFELWTGRSAPLAVMSAAALTELADPSHPAHPSGPAHPSDPAQPSDPAHPEPSRDV